MLISIISLICIINYGKLENDIVKVRNRRILSRVCYANIQPINQSLTYVLALYQRRTDNGRGRIREALECGRGPQAMCLVCDADRERQVVRP